MSAVLPVPADDPRLVALVPAQERELEQRYGPGADHGFAQPPLHADTRWLLLVDDDGGAAGCVAVQPLSHTLPGAAPTDGEVKRLYVLPAYRGHGHSRTLMVAVEDLAVRSGYRALQLETGLRQPEAVALYERSGYTRVAPYGHYRSSPQSVCFRKSLPATQHEG
ncbi:MAG TPA: GNAT family N-acetyltransferase [Candidatus Nanopelagicales bacterium]|nr:GNAT family N-acetyltransferase [Candidatus Nanopelagicales bacterium]